MKMFPFQIKNKYTTKTPHHCRRIWRVGSLTPSTTLREPHQNQQSQQKNSNRPLASWGQTKNLAKRKGKSIPEVAEVVNQPCLATLPRFWTSSSLWPSTPIPDTWLNCHRIVETSVALPGFSNNYPNHLMVNLPNRQEPHRNNFLEITLQQQLELRV